MNLEEPPKQYRERNAGCELDWMMNFPYCFRWISVNICATDPNPQHTGTISYWLYPIKPEKHYWLAASRRYLSTSITFYNIKFLWCPHQYPNAYSIWSQSTISSAIFALPIQPSPVPLDKNSWWMILAAILQYPLISSLKAIENGHRNSRFTYFKWWCSIAIFVYVYQRRFSRNPDAMNFSSINISSFQQELYHNVLPFFWFPWYAHSYPWACDIVDLWWPNQMLVKTDIFPEISLS